MLGRPISRVRHARLPGETPLDLARRLAPSAAFAFSIGPDRTAAQPDFDFFAEAFVLPEAVGARAKARGRISMARGAARIAATGADQLFIYVIEDGAFDMHPTRYGRRLRSGDILILDLAQAAALLGTECEAIMMVLARGALPERCGALISTARKSAATTCSPAPSPASARTRRA